MRKLLWCADGIFSKLTFHFRKVNRPGHPFVFKESSPLPWPNYRSENDLPFQFPRATNPQQRAGEWADDVQTHDMEGTGEADEAQNSRMGKAGGVQKIARDRVRDQGEHPDVQAREFADEMRSASRRNREAGRAQRVKVEDDPRFTSAWEPPSRVPKEASRAEDAKLVDYILGILSQEQDSRAVGGKRPELLDLVTSMNPAERQQVLDALLDENSWLPAEQLDKVLEIVQASLYGKGPAPQGQAKGDVPSSKTKPATEKPMMKTKKATRGKIDSKAGTDRYLGRAGAADPLKPQHTSREGVCNSSSTIPKVKDPHIPRAGRGQAVIQNNKGTDRLPGLGDFGNKPEAQGTTQEVACDVHAIDNTVFHSAKEMLPLVEEVQFVHEVVPATPSRKLKRPDPVLQDPAKMQKEIDELFEEGPNKPSIETVGDAGHMEVAEGIHDEDIPGHGDAENPLLMTVRETLSLVSVEEQPQSNSRLHADESLMSTTTKEASPPTEEQSCSHHKDTPNTSTGKESILAADSASADTVHNPKTATAPEKVQHAAKEGFVAKSHIGPAMEVTKQPGTNGEASALEYDILAPSQRSLQSENEPSSKHLEGSSYADPVLTSVRESVPSVGKASKIGDLEVVAVIHKPVTVEKSNMTTQRVVKNIEAADSAHNQARDIAAAKRSCSISNVDSEGDITQTKTSGEEEFKLHSDIYLGLQLLQGDVKAHHQETPREVFSGSHMAVSAQESLPLTKDSFSIGHTRVTEAIHGVTSTEENTVTDSGTDTANARVPKKPENTPEEESMAGKGNGRIGFGPEINVTQRARSTAEASTLESSSSKPCQQYLAKESEYSVDEPEEKTSDSVKDTIIVTPARETLPPVEGTPHGGKTGVAEDGLLIVPTDENTVAAGSNVSSTLLKSPDCLVQFPLQKQPVKNQPFEERHGQTGVSEPGKCLASLQHSPSGCSYTVVGETVSSICHGTEPEAKELVGMSAPLGQVEPNKLDFCNPQPRTETIQVSSSRHGLIADITLDLEDDGSDCGDVKEDCTEEEDFSFNPSDERYTPECDAYNIDLSANEKLVQKLASEKENIVAETGAAASRLQELEDSGDKPKVQRTPGEGTCSVSHVGSEVEGTQASETDKESLGLSVSNLLQECPEESPGVVKCINQILTPTTRETLTPTRETLSPMKEVCPLGSVGEAEQYHEAISGDTNMTEGKGRGTAIKLDGDIGTDTEMEKERDPLEAHAVTAERKTFGTSYLDPEMEWEHWSGLDDDSTHGFRSIPQQLAQKDNILVPEEMSEERALINVDENPMDTPATKPLPFAKDLSCVGEVVAAKDAQELISEENTLARGSVVTASWNVLHPDSVGKDPMQMQEEIDKLFERRPEQLGPEDEQESLLASFESLSLDEFRDLLRGPEFEDQTEAPAPDIATESDINPYSKKDLGRVRPALAEGGISTAPKSDKDGDESELQVTAAGGRACGFSYVAPEVEAIKKLDEPVTAKDFLETIPTEENTVASVVTEGLLIPSDPGVQVLEGVQAGIEGSETVGPGETQEFLLASLEDSSLEDFYGVVGQMMSSIIHETTPDPQDHAEIPLSASLANQPSVEMACKTTSGRATKVAEASTFRLAGLRYVGNTLNTQGTAEGPWVDCWIDPNLQAALNPRENEETKMKAGAELGELCRLGDVGNTSKDLVAAGKGACGVGQASQELRETHEPRSDDGY